MTTSELIKLLKEADPDGDTPVSVQNFDIMDVEREPAYHDGCLQQLHRDPSIETYNVISAEYISSGFKVVLTSLSIKEAVFQNPDLKIEFENSPLTEKYRQNVDEWRKEANPPKCGNTGEQWGRYSCEYDETGTCIHCGEEISF